MCRIQNWMPKMYWLHLDCTTTALLLWLCLTKFAYVNLWNLWVEKINYWTWWHFSHWLSLTDHDSVTFHFITLSLQLLNIDDCYQATFKCQNVVSFEGDVKISNDRCFYWPNSNIFFWTISIAWAYLWCYHEEIGIIVL